MVTVLSQFSVFSAPPSIQQQPEDAPIHPGAMDSITLGQLRSMNVAASKPKVYNLRLISLVLHLLALKQVYYKFTYGDEDEIMNEIDEFYSYVEAPQVEENMKAWEGYFKGGQAQVYPFHAYYLTLLSEWTKSPIETRKSYIEFLLESLEHRDADVRFTNARRLMYVLQGMSLLPLSFFNKPNIFLAGTFAETSYPEDQLQWIIENSKLVRSLNGLSTILEALKIANSKHDLLS